MADFFTKALPADKFLKFRQIVMNLEPYSQPSTPGGLSLLSLTSECGGVSHDVLAAGRRDASPVHDMAKGPLRPYPILDEGT